MIKLKKKTVGIMCPRYEIFVSFRLLDFNSIILKRKEIELKFFII